MNKGGIQQELSKAGTVSRYRSAVIGDGRFSEFLLYEFTAVAFSPLPGRFGMYARRIFMPLLFRRFGRRVTMSRDVTFRRPHQIRIGNGVTLESGVTLDVKSNIGSIDIHDDVFIGKNTILSCPGGVIVIGQGTHIGSNCRLGSLKGLTIGSHATIDNRSCIVGAGHSYNSRDLPIIQQPLTCKGPTIIDDMVAIEKEVTVLDGVHIYSKARIMEGSMVNKDIAPDCFASGVPASPC